MQKHPSVEECQHANTGLHPGILARRNRKLSTPLNMYSEEHEEGEKNKHKMYWRLSWFCGKHFDRKQLDCKTLEMIKREMHH